MKKLGEIIEIGTISPQVIRVAETNNRTDPISERDKMELNKSISEVGVVEPVILNENNEIVGGQLRWTSALVNNLKSIPYVKMKFHDKFSERIASILQDYHHHPLSDKDKGLFVRKCIEEDKRTLEDIATSLGIEIQTVRSWLRFDQVPKVIEENAKLKQSYFKLPFKKRIATESILSRAPYKDDQEKAIELIEFASEAPLRELEQARKDVVKRTPVNAEQRKLRLKQNCVLIEVKIPRYLDNVFREKLRKENKDYTEVLVSLIEQYVRQ
jgi:ParB family chromosome partitioning protein